MSKYLPNPNEPWNVAPKDPNGDPDIDDTYRAVGYALTRWAEVENILSLLFSQIVGTNRLIGHRIYGSIIQSSGRGDLLVAAAQGRFFNNQALLDEILTLTSIVGKFAARRNEFAHGATHNYVNGAYLAPPYSDTRKKRDLIGIEEKYRYNSTQILYYAEEFKKLANEAFALLQKVPSQPHGQ